MDHRSIILPILFSVYFFVLYALSITITCCIGNNQNIPTYSVNISNKEKYESLLISVTWRVKKKKILRIKHENIVFYINEQEKNTWLFEWKIVQFQTTWKIEVDRLVSSVCILALHSLICFIFVLIIIPFNTYNT